MGFDIFEINLVMVLVAKLSPDRLVLNIDIIPAHDKKELNQPIVESKRPQILLASHQI